MAEDDAPAALVRRTVRFVEDGRLRRTSLRMERFLWDRVREIVEAEGITPVEFFTRVRTLRGGSFVGAVRLVAIGVLHMAPDSAGPPVPRPPLRLVE